MKYIFGKYSQNLPYNITQQVRDLNQLVTDELVPMIINNCRSKQKYLRDISTQPLGPELPTNINSNPMIVNNLLYYLDNKNKLSIVN